MSKKNCWEVKNCGREAGGAKTEELGVCPATTDTSIDGTNSGYNGGRVCWAVSGTFCEGQVQGTYAQKESSCLNCDFYRNVKKEESFITFTALLPGQEVKRSGND